MHDAGAFAASTKLAVHVPERLKSPHSPGGGESVVPVLAQAIAPASAPMGIHQNLGTAFDIAPIGCSLPQEA
jgi:hypothetical protein